MSGHPNKVMSSDRRTRRSGESIRQESPAASLTRRSVAGCVEVPSATVEVTARALRRHRGTGIQTSVLLAAGHRASGVPRCLSRRPM